MNMTKKPINASDRDPVIDPAFDGLDGPRRELLYRRFLLNQSNASIRRTTGTQTPDPVLPVPTMLKPYNRNPLTIHIASHTGSEVRGEGNLMRRRSGNAGFHDGDFVGVDLCVDPIIPYYAVSPTGSFKRRQSTCCACLMEIIFLCRGDSRVARNVAGTNPPILLNDFLSLLSTTTIAATKYYGSTCREEPSGKFKKTNPFPPNSLTGKLLTLLKFGSFGSDWRSCKPRRHRKITAAACRQGIKFQVHYLNNHLNPYHPNIRAALTSSIGISGAESFCLSEITHSRSKLRRGDPILLLTLLPSSPSKRISRSRPDTTAVWMIISVSKFDMLSLAPAALILCRKASHISSTAALWLEKSLMMISSIRRLYDSFTDLDNLSNPRDMMMISSTVNLSRPIFAFSRRRYPPRVRSKTIGKCPAEIVFRYRYSDLVDIPQTFFISSGLTDRRWFRRLISSNIFDILSIHLRMGWAGPPRPPHNSPVRICS